MSSFVSTVPLQLHNFSSSGRLRFWSQDCLLCLAECGASMLCAACSRELETDAPACPRCALPLAPGASRCTACGGERHAFDRAVARFEYRFPLDRLVQRFKYAGDLSIGRWLAGALAERVAHEPRPHLLVVPPLSPSRLRARGFNQAIEIARVVGRRIGVPLRRDAVARRRETPSQAALGRRERAANLRGAFACTRPLTDLDVALVDDVLTTGATADAIARTLKEAGARSVAAWTIARAPEPHAP
jgi:ComF family protein